VNPTGFSSDTKKEWTMNIPDWLHPGVILGTVLYAVIGVFVLWLAFLIIDRITPYDLWKEICETRNIALAIVVAGMFVALGLIIAAAIHG
jgi:putative membrane protein